MNGLQWINVSFFSFPDKVMDNEQLLPMVDGKPIAWQHHVGQIEKLSKFGHRSAHFQIKAVSPNVEALQMKEKGLVISSGHGVCHHTCTICGLIHMCHYYYLVLSLLSLSSILRLLGLCVDYFLL